MTMDARLRHLNECRIFHNINSITFLLYTFDINRRWSGGAMVLCKLTVPGRPTNLD